MSLTIGAIGGVNLTNFTQAVKPLTASEPGAFQKVLSGAVQQVEDIRVSADKKVQNFLSGEGEELHNVVLETQKAEMSLELFQQMRNKVVQAYSEVMRMQM